MYYRKLTFKNQNKLPEVDFWKSKYITESRILEVKILFLNLSFSLIIFNTLYKKIILYIYIYI